MLDRSPIASLGDDELLRSLKAVAARSNQITALLLAHLAEVEARGAHRLWACPTLQAYCVYELRLSEDEAQRRCRAARLARQFPRLLDMLAESSLHLTGLLLVGPHLTAENEGELLARVSFRTKREIEKILAEVAPRPDVPSIVQPLGPAGDGVPPRAPGSWTSIARGQAGFARHLPPGVGPSDAPAISAGESEELAAATTPAAAPHETIAAHEDNAAREMTPASETNEHAPSRETKPHPALGSATALRYRVQFTADQQFVDLLSEARDLLWHQLPDGDLATVQRLALEALVAQLRQRKYAASRRPAAEAAPAAPARSPAAPARATSAGAAPARSPTGGEREESAAPGQATAASARSSAVVPNDVSPKADGAPARSSVIVAATVPRRARTCQPGCAERCGSATGGAARSWTRAACAALRPRPSSFTTSTRTRSAGRPRGRTSRCAAVLTIDSPRRSTLAPSTSPPAPPGRRPVGHDGGAGRGSGRARLASGHGRAAARRLGRRSARGAGLRLTVTPGS